MSVYSGFATRQQEKRYNECLEYALSILTKRLYRFYTGEGCNQGKFIYLLTSIHDKMQQLEENKYLQPHFSHILTEFLRGSAQFSRMKEDDSFSQTFAKGNESHLKIKFNTLEAQHGPEDVPESKLSRLTLNERKVNFKSRGKTVTPQNNTKTRFFTPQKNSRLEEHQAIKDKIEKEHIFHMPEKHQPPRFTEAPRIEKIQNGSKSRQLSPREFLRQTVKGKQSFSHIGMRAKQKHQKIVKI